MAELDPLDLTTRKERIVVAAAALGSLAFHLLVFFGSYASLWPERREEETRLMIVRRIPEEQAPETIREQAPARRAQQREEAVVERGEQPEPGEQQEEPSEPQEERETQEQREPSPPQKEGLEKERKENTISVYTDLGQAFFRLEGPVSHKGAGTFWEKSGMPAGAYSITFGTVEGYETPAAQSAELEQGGSLVFVGRYTKMTQVSVDVIPEGAKFTILRPDGRHLELSGNRQGLFRDLPLGDYTIVFTDMPGYATPSPQTRRLGPGGHLYFSGVYSPTGGTGAGGGEGGLGAAKKPRKVAEATLDRRIKMIVKSYPETGIEERHGLITYPEVVIRKSNYQAGWCQVYVIVRIDGTGQVEKVFVERPRPDELERFRPLVEVVEQAARSWDYDRREAEVHVDVRFFVER